MTSTFKATTSAQQAALLEALARDGYEVKKVDRLGASNYVQVVHDDDQAADVEAVVRAIDPHAKKRD
jgi:hypothetical protein